MRGFKLGDCVRVNTGDTLRVHDGEDVYLIADLPATELVNVCPPSDKVLELKLAGVMRYFVAGVRGEEIVQRDNGWCVTGNRGSELLAGPFETLEAAKAACAVMEG